MTKEADTDQHEKCDYHIKLTVFRVTLLSKTLITAISREVTVSSRVLSKLPSTLSLDRRTDDIFTRHVMDHVMAFFSQYYLFFIKYRVPSLVKYL